MCALMKQLYMHNRSIFFRWPFYLTTGILFIVLTAIDAYAANADSVTVPVSTQYTNAHFITRLINGKNYRAVWKQPVKMPVFDIGKVNGGLKITKLGGGFQTKSLRLKDKKGTNWVLRTVDKEVSQLLPRFLQNSMADKVFQDLISAAYPYAPLTVTDMGKAIGVITPDPVLYYVPDDPRLGEHREIFANKVCFFERHEPTPDYSDAIDTDDVLEKLSQPDVAINQDVMLRARLLDMLLGDWDRHEGQWRWGRKDSTSKTYFYPMPVDRDQAYFRATGAMPALVTISILPHMSGFHKSNSDIIDLNFKSYAFDRIFLNEMTEQDWMQHIANFRASMTDSVIELAIGKLPPEIYALTGEMLITKLKSRRDGLEKDGMKYYRYLTTDVYVLGKEEPETVELVDSGDQATLVVYNTKTKKQYYRRSLNPRHTKKIHLYGMNENDIVKATKPKIKIVKESLEPIKLL